MESEYEVKPQVIKTQENFEKKASEYLSRLEEYKKLDKMMKQYEADIKNYMVENDIDTYKNEVGRITIDYSKRNCLNRALIEDIRQYYEEIPVVTMRKTLNSAKPARARQPAELT